MLNIQKKYREYLKSVVTLLESINIDVSTQKKTN